MLLVKTPNRDSLLQILRGLQQQKYSRNEIVAWQKAVMQKDGWDIPLAVADGYWYFYSMAYLTLPFGTDGLEYLVRAEDIDEYILDIEHKQDDWEYEGVKRLRGHEIDTRLTHWPLSLYQLTESNQLSTRGVTTVRGTFERRQDLVEHTHFRYRDATYLIVRQLDNYSDEAMILGTDRDEGKLKDFITLLGLD